MPSKQVARYNERIAAAREADRAATQRDEDQRKREEDAAEAAAAEATRLAEEAAAKAAADASAATSVVEAEVLPPVVMDDIPQDAPEVLAERALTEDEAALVAAGTPPEGYVEGSTGTMRFTDPEGIVEATAADTDVVSEPEATAVVITEVLKTRQARKPRSK